MYLSPLQQVLIYCKLALHEPSHMLDHSNFRVDGIFEVDYIFCFERLLELCVLRSGEVPVEGGLGRVSSITPTFSFHNFPFSIGGRETYVSISTSVLVGSLVLGST
jgi:hypothetical protein